jgi:MOB kinase activator 1
MSGFISTMFVTSSYNIPLAFPAKPKPLLPLFTFAQSQSCMNLRMDLDVAGLHAQSSAVDIWSEFDYSRSGLEISRSEMTCLSPLQRIGQALRLQQTGSDTIPYAPAPAPLPEPRAHSSIDNATPEPPNCSLKLISSAPVSTIQPELRKDVALGSRSDMRGLVGTGSIVSPTSKAQQETPRSKGFFAGTRLPFFLFSNPRTRAPFKPQKSNRGTSSWQLKQYAEATLGSGSLRKAVKLPEGEDKDEWLAVNGEQCRGSGRELC